MQHLSQGRPPAQHIVRKPFKPFGPQLDCAEPRGHLLRFELVGVGIWQGNMIPVEVAHDHIGGVFQGCHDFPADLLSNRHLYRVGEQPMTSVAQR